MGSYGGLAASLAVLLAIAVTLLAFEFLETADGNKILNPDRQTYEIPQWVKQNAYWWSQGHITDNEFSYSLEYLIDQNIIKIQKCEGECS